jgi:hypothetical protein
MGAHSPEAHDGTRTRDLFLTKEVLCRLSYVSTTGRARSVGASPSSTPPRVPRRGGFPCKQHGRRESNPQPPVLETGALPIELLPFTLHGQGGNRTPDTTIFSRVLYQLSYLAGDPIKKPPSFGGRGPNSIAGAGFEPATFGL